MSEEAAREVVISIERALNDAREDHRKALEKMRDEQVRAEAIRWHTLVLESLLKDAIRKLLPVEEVEF